MSLESTANEAIAHNLEQFLLVLTISLSVATLSRTVAFLRKIPYTLLLVIVGMGLAFLDLRLVNLSPELILEIFLPPLLFEAAWNIPWAKLKEYWVTIVLLAVIYLRFGSRLSPTYFCQFTPIDRFSVGCCPSCHRSRLCDCPI